MSQGSEPTLFQTDDQLAQRLRQVEKKLRDREPAAARELAEIARILDPDGAGRNA